MIRTALLLALAIPRVVGADASTVEFASQDGFQLTATLWQDETSAPGILLLHQCDADRTMYDELAAKLADAGFRVLALEFRGDSATAEFPEDVEAAYRYLQQQGEGTVVGALGAKCGGREVIALADGHSDLRMLAFLSAQLSPAEEKSALQLSSRPMLFISGRGDLKARRSAGLINYRTRQTNLMLFDGEANGYHLFEQYPELPDSIVTWFVSRLAER